MKLTQEIKDFLWNLAGLAATAFFAFPMAGIVGVTLLCAPFVSRCWVPPGQYFTLTALTAGLLWKASATLWALSWLGLAGMVVGGLLLGGVIYNRATLFDFGEVFETENLPPLLEVDERVVFHYDQIAHQCMRNTLEALNETERNEIINGFETIDEFVRMFCVTLKIQYVNQNSFYTAINCCDNEGFLNNLKNICNVQHPSPHILRRALYARIVDIFRRELHAVLPFTVAASSILNAQNPPPYLPSETGYVPAVQAGLVPVMPAPVPAVPG